MDSSFNTLPESQSTNQNTPEQYNSDNESINIITSSNNNYKDSIYNNPQYKLESNEDSNIYIFKNGLFTRSVLNIDVNKEREILISCTTCSYKKITTIKGFQSSNYVQHYKNKHPNIAYNEKTENKLIKRANLPLKTDFLILLLLRIVEKDKELVLLSLIIPNLITNLTKKKLMIKYSILL